MPKSRDPVGLEQECTVDLLAIKNYTYIASGRRRKSVCLTATNGLPLIPSTRINQLFPLISRLQAPLVSRTPPGILSPAGKVEAVMYWYGSSGGVVFGLTFYIDGGCPGLVPGSGRVIRATGFRPHHPDHPRTYRPGPGQGLAYQTTLPRDRTSQVRTAPPPR